MAGQNGPDLEPVEVLTRCVCPAGNVHQDGERFTLPARLGFHELALVNKAARWLKTERPQARPSEVLATISEAYVRYCLAGWTLHGEPSKAHPDGEPIECTPENIERYLMGPDAADVAQEIADRADDLYGGAVLGPLVRRASELSEGSRTGGSTSRSRTNGASRKQSSRYSTTSTPTAGTA